MDSISLVCHQKTIAQLLNFANEVSSGMPSDDQQTKPQKHHQLQSNQFNQKMQQIQTDSPEPNVTQVCLSLNRVSLTLRTENELLTCISGTNLVVMVNLFSPSNSVTVHVKNAEYNILHLFL